MSKGKGVVGLLGVIVAVLVAGCGSSGSDSTITTAEFTKQAGAICKEAEEKRVEGLAAIAEQAPPSADVEAQQEKAIRQVMPTYEEAAEQIDKLGAPKGEEQKVEALVEAMEEAAEKATADPHTAAVSNIFFRKADQLAEPYNLTGCII